MSAVYATRTIRLRDASAPTYRDGSAFSLWYKTEVHCIYVSQLRKSWASTCSTSSLWNQALRMLCSGLWQVNLPCGPTSVRACTLLHVCLCNICLDIYIYIYICIYIPLHVCVSVNMHASLHMSVKNARMCTYLHLYTCISFCMPRSHMQFLAHTREEKYILIPAWHIGVMLMGLRLDVLSYSSNTKICWNIFKVKQTIRVDAQCHKYPVTVWPCDRVTVWPCDASGGSSTDDIRVKNVSFLSVSETASIDSDLVGQRNIVSLYSKYNALPWHFNSQRPDCVCCAYCVV